MNEDVVWINLKVLAKIPPYHRINTQNELFYIEKNTLWHPSSLWRFFRGDNRELAIKRIDDLIEKATVMLEKVTPESVYENLLQHLRNAENGLVNLQKTYVDDFTTNASIDRLLDKIHSLLPCVTQGEQEQA